MEIILPTGRPSSPRNLHPFDERPADHDFRRARYVLGKKASVDERYLHQFEEAVADGVLVGHIEALPVRTQQPDIISRHAMQRQTAAGRDPLHLGQLPISSTIRTRVAESCPGTGQKASRSNEYPGSLSSMKRCCRPIAISSETSSPAAANCRNSRDSFHIRLLSMERRKAKVTGIRRTERPGQAL